MQLKHQMRPRRMDRQLTLWRKVEDELTKRMATPAVEFRPVGIKERKINFVRRIFEEEKQVGQEIKLLVLESVNHLD